MHQHQKNNLQPVRVEHEQAHAIRRYPSEFRAWLIVVVLLIVGIALLTTAKHLLGAFELAPVPESPDAARLRRYSDQLNNLKADVATVISDNLETRMRGLEQSIAAGSVGSSEIQALDDISRDLRLLEKYTSENNGHAMDTERMVHPRLRPSMSALPNDNTEVANKSLQELLRVKHLLYFSVASCSMALVFVGGYWWRNSLHIRRLPADTSRRGALPKPDD